MSVRCSWMRQAVVAACALVCSSVALSQSTWYVDAAADLGGDGSASFPFTTIQLGINAADLVSGDLILVAPGTYSQRIDYQGKNIRVDRWGPDGEVVIEPSLPGSEPGAVVLIDGTDWGHSQGLANVTVQGGWHPVAGGGLLIDGPGPLIEDCTFRNNFGRTGGGGVAVYTPGTPLIRGCRFEGNASSVAGAPWAGSVGGGLSGRGVIVRDCVFEGNVAGDGGGAGAPTADPLVCEGCTFLDNEATGSGGGAYNIQATNCVFEGNVATRWGGGSWFSDLENCLLTGNSATEGGGAFGGRASRCTLVGNIAVGTSESIGTGGGASNAHLYDCLIAANSADRGGGASSLMVDRCLFVANTAKLSAAALFGGATRSRIVGHVTDNSVVDGALTHCVMWDNEALEGGALFGLANVRNSIVRGNLGPLGSPGKQLIISYSNVEGGYPGEGNIDAPARFWSPDGGPNGEQRDFHLMPGSPCIDAGSPALPLDPDGSRADMGVYPFDPEWFQAIAYCEAGTTTSGCQGAMSWTGVPSATAGSGFELVAAGIEGQTTGLLFYGTNGADSRSLWPTSSSLLCVVTPAQRMTLQGTGGTAGSCDGELREDFNLYIASHPAANGVPFTAGDTVWAQGWFRDLGSPAGHHLTNGLQFTVGP